MIFSWPFNEYFSSYSTYFVSLQGLGNNETLWELLVVRVDGHITCMFWFDDLYVPHSIEDAALSSVFVVHTCVHFYI